MFYKWKDKNVSPRFNELSTCETCQYAMNLIFIKNMINHMLCHAIGFLIGKINQKIMLIHYNNNI